MVHALLVSAIVLSVCLASCNGSNGSTTIPESTKVLDETTLNYLSGASVNSSTLVFENTTDQLSSLSVGDVIVSGVSEATPYGLLRKVTNIVADGNQMTVETVAATLEDAIQDCTIDTNWRLQSDGNFAPLGSNEAINALGESVEALATGFYLQLDDVVLYDNDGNLDTRGDQITADLSVNLNIDVDIGWTISWFRMTEAHFQSTISVTSEVETSCTVAVLEIHPKLEVYRQYLAPFTVMVGPVPVVILPMLSINIGLDGEVSAGITAGVTANAELTAGVQYANGDWSPITDFSTSFDWQEPSLTAGCKVKVSAGPQLSLLLYGEAGPYIEVRGYLELDADIFRTPWWELYGGLEADVGFKVEAMGHTIADYEKPLAIGYRVLLAQAGTPTLVTLTISSTVGGSVTTPGEGTYNYDEGTVVDLVATPDTGYRFVNWTGDIGTIGNVNAATTTITMGGDYSITANFEEIPKYDLTISSTAGGSVTAPGEGTFTYNAGTVVNLVATPDAGYRFVSWTGDVGTIANVNAATTTITMNGDCSISANFEEEPEYNAMIAFFSYRDGNADIYVMNGDGSGQTNITCNPGDDWDPSCSPDGKKIVFQSWRDGNAEIYVMDSDGSAQLNLTNDLGEDSHPDWSPVGTKIAFCSDRHNPGGGCDIYVMNADGSNPIDLTNSSGHDWYPAWSPDGTEIAFSSNQDGDFEIYVMNADGSNLRRLTSSGKCIQPTWSPDGSQIAFARESWGARHIYVMSADGSNLQQITKGLSEDNRDPNWFPGQKIVFSSNQDGNYDIYVMDADGSNQARLTFDPADDYHPAWGLCPE